MHDFKKLPPGQVVMKFRPTLYRFFSCRRILSRKLVAFALGQYFLHLWLWCLFLFSTIVAKEMVK